MRLEALDHPKTLDLAARLNVELPTAIGMLELLWAFTGKKSPQGNIGKFPDGAIARSCYWMGDPQVFLDGLVAAGFVDEHPVHRLCIHDWADHCPRWVHAKLKKAGLELIPTVVPTVVATTEHIPRARAFPREGKGREGKCIHAHPETPTAVRTPEPSSEGNGGARPTPAQQTAADWSDGQLADAFAAVRLSYPARTGRQDWITAEHHWRQRLDQGATPEQLLAGVERYAAFVTAGGVSGPAFVLGPEKFFGDRDQPWSQRWDPPLGKAETRLANNLNAADEFMRRTESA
jgi:hypothetical protein